MADLKAVTLKDVELRWAHLAEPATKGEFASNKYEVLVVMGKDNAKLVKDLKSPQQDLKDLGDGLYGITLKSSKQPQVMWKNKARLTDDELRLIGNGTKAIVKANQYTGFKGKVFLGLQAIMVTELVEYAGADPFADIDAVTDDAAPFDTDDDLI